MFIRSVRPLSADKLATLTTPRLNAYRRKLLAVQESVVLSDLSPRELAGLDPSLLYFKEDPAWQDLHRVVTSMLQQRSMEKTAKAAL